MIKEYNIDQLSLDDAVLSYHDFRTKENVTLKDIHLNNVTAFVDYGVIGIKGNINTLEGGKLKIVIVPIQGSKGIIIHGTITISEYCGDGCTFEQIIYVSGKLTNNGSYNTIINKILNIEPMAGSVRIKRLNVLPFAY